MANQPANILLRSPMFRMSYPNLVEARAYQDPRSGRKGDPEFSCDMLLTPEALDEFEGRRDDEWETMNVKNAMAEVAKAEWPDINLRDAVANGGLKWPLVDGNTKKQQQEAKGKKGDVYENMKVIPIKAKEGYPPQLFVLDQGKFRELSRNNEADMGRAKDLFVGGHYAKASLNLKAMHTPQGRFLVFYCNAVLFVKEGQRIGGMSAEERFGGISGGSADHDPTEGLDDEIPF